MKTKGLKNKAVFIFLLLPITIFAQFSCEKIIAHYNGDICFVNYADLDEDGDLDIISGGFWDNQLRWHENDGVGNFSFPKIISIKVDGLEYGIAGDLDNDGDIDVISASIKDYKLAKYENEGNGVFSEQQIISLDIRFNQFSNFLFLEDLDADNDLDIIYLSSGGTFWYENDGAGNFSDKKLILGTSNPYGAGQVIDIDNDGDLDIISVSGGRAQDIICRKNDGLGNFTNPIIIVKDEVDIESITTADIDGDKDLDIIVGVYEKRMIAWYEQLADGVYSEKKIISTAVNLPEDVSSADLDKDGDMDVLSVSWGDKKVAWYENNGTGNFSEQKLLGGYADNPIVVHAADLDGDGDKDVLFGTMGNNKIGWFENLLVITCIDDLDANEIGTTILSNIGCANEEKKIPVFLSYATNRKNRESVQRTN